MKIDVTTVLTTPTGEPFQDGVGLKVDYEAMRRDGVYEKYVSGKESKDFTLRASLMMGLLQAPEKDGDQKYENWRMAMKIQENDVIELDSKEITHLKEVCTFQQTAVMGRVYDLIDPKTDD